MCTFIYVKLVCRIFIAYTVVCTFISGRNECAQGFVRKKNCSKTTHIFLIKVFLIRKRKTPSKFPVIHLASFYS